MRRHYIDNIRWLVVLLLFPYHTARIFDNNHLESFYVKGETSPVYSAFMMFCNPWFMPLLFTVAGMSTFYSLQKRSYGNYLNERFCKLFIPLVSGILFLIPVQTYFAERFHNAYCGGYFQQYILFFTKETNLTGYYGGFTPGQFWFILYLFIISLTALPFIIFYEKIKRRLGSTIVLPAAILLVILLAAVMSRILNVDGKDIGGFFSIFMLGYLVLSYEKVMEALARVRWLLIGVALLLIMMRLAAFYGHFDWYRDFRSSFRLEDKITSLVSVLAVLALGKRHLNFRNAMTDYFSRTSFLVYVFHQSWIVLIGYYVVKATAGPVFPFFLTLILSIGMTFLTCALSQRSAIASILFEGKRPRPLKKGDGG